MRGLRHASPSDLVDLADGLERPHLREHLQHCSACRDQLAELVDMMGCRDLAGSDGHAGDAHGGTANRAGTARDVPEPSPLFWTHFPERVGRALERTIDQEPDRWARARRLTGLVPRRVAPALAVALVVGVAVGATFSSRSRERDVGAEYAATGPAPGEPVVGDDQPTDDTSWAMLLLMAETASWEGDDTPELFVTDGAGDRAIFELSRAERLELKRLLESAIDERAVESS